MKMLFSSTDIPTEVSEGDVVIVKSDYFFSFYYVVGAECKLMEKAKTIKFVKEKNAQAVVFEYSDLAPRKGDPELLRFFVGIFKRAEVVGYLQNALDILLYKEDKWDAALLQALVVSEGYAVEASDKQSFTDFLDEESRHYYERQMALGHQVPSAFRLVKNKYPKVFAQSLKLFHAAFPDKSIYD